MMTSGAIAAKTYTYEYIFIYMYFWIIIYACRPWRGQRSRWGRREVLRQIHIHLNIYSYTCTSKYMFTLTGRGGGSARDDSVGCYCGACVCVGRSGGGCTGCDSGVLHWAHVFAAVVHDFLSVVSDMCIYNQSESVFWYIYIYLYTHICVCICVALSLCVRRCGTWFPVSGTWYVRSPFINSQCVCIHRHICVYIFVVWSWCLRRCCACLSVSCMGYGEVGGWGRVPFSRNLMSPTPRRKWYLTTGRRFH